MNKNKEEIICLVLTALRNQDIVDENKIKVLVDTLKAVYSISAEEEKEVIKELHSRLSVKMDVGSCIKEKNHVSWYYNEKKNIEGKYWNRYLNYLVSEKGFNNKVISALDDTTDEIMDLLGNPNQLEGFFRKGLVIGDVQSGKTSTYTAIINKAADAGYRVIILLTGTIEKLRQQTQGRLDEGFVGLDSKALVRDRDNVRVGVGNLDPTSMNAFSYTSTVNDFNKKISNQLAGQLVGINVPVLFVLKKNKSVLTRIEQWLRKYNAVNNKINLPMLLIDDEADNASVNTRKDEESPTAINFAIRKLLELFTHANYVAFTATPYANIFINPETDEKMVNEDLFPKHFIYSLESPSNYIGANSIFGEDGMHEYMLNENDDIELCLPLNHKKEYVPEYLPDSLKEAILSFFIANAIRDLRGNVNTHRSMLINVSRFINVQNEIRKLVVEFVQDCQREFKMYGQTGELALKHNKIKMAKFVYEKQFEHKNIPESIKESIFSWEEIQERMDDSISSIVVRTVNGGNSQKNLNYDENEENGLRIIAIGGFSLSRGLTLEGLSTSYFYRNSKMYDTLMQMGRWFGYRPHYADLCRIWMSNTSRDWYEYITLAQEELKNEVKKMMNADKTPEDFGLGVRSDINSLLVTAVNKMRNTKEVTMAISLCGSVIETTYIPLNHEVNKKNKDVISCWIDSLIDSGYNFVDHKKIDNYYEKLDQNHNQIINVEKEKIIELLNEFSVSPYNLNFRTEDILKIIDNDKEGRLNKWDVIIADNKKNSCVQVGKYLEIGPIGRSYTVNTLKKYIQMSGSKSRLGSVNYAKGGLTHEEVEIIESKAMYNRIESNKKKAFNQNEYFNTGFIRNPLLMIYPVRLNHKNENDEINEEITKYNDVYFGLGIGIPDIEGKGKIMYSYTINMVKWRELLGVDDEDFLEETGEEE